MQPRPKNGSRSMIWCCGRCSRTWWCAVGTAASAAGDTLQNGRRGSMVTIKFESIGIEEDCTAATAHWHTIPPVVVTQRIILPARPTLVAACRRRRNATAGGCCPSAHWQRRCGACRHPRRRPQPPRIVVARDISEMKVGQQFVWVYENALVVVIIVRIFYKLVSSTHVPSRPAGHARHLPRALRRCLDRPTTMTSH